MPKFLRPAEGTYTATATKPVPPFDGRKPLIAGNWKMNLNHLEAIALVQRLAFSLKEELFHTVEVAVLPPFVDIRSVQTLIDGDNLLIKYGAQDLSQHDSGAYTGDISGAMLAKLGCSFVTVGHSEQDQSRLPPRDHPDRVHRRRPRRARGRRPGAALHRTVGRRAGRHPGRAGRVDRDRLRTDLGDRDR
jgi:hypothetical protein